MRTPDTIRLSIALEETQFAAPRATARSAPLEWVSSRVVSSIVKVTHDAPDPGALIPAQKAAGCTARAIRPYAPTLSVLRNPKREAAHGRISHST